MKINGTTIRSNTKYAVAAGMNLSDTQIISQHETEEAAYNAAGKISIPVYVIDVEGIRRTAEGAVHKVHGLAVTF